ncbi:MAG: hypothetical protein K2X38_05405 [Gemmataceae bacterium]|nr:hypothetical protein [Gemmataceae bacterium]
MFQKLLFGVTMAVALGLGGAVTVAPTFFRPETGQHRLLEIYAEDLAVRRTSLACALGLAVTAFVFFRGSKPALPMTMESKPKESAPAAA